MRRRYVTADVFTNRLFGGNPLAVVLDATGLSPEEMQAIALEFNYSETTFVLPPSDPAHTAQVRIFTPRIEIPFAGQPNVGTAFVLAQQMLARGETVPERFLFEEKGGLVPVRLFRENNAVVGAELTAPRSLSRLSSATLAEAAACLSLSPEDLRADAHPPQVLSVGLPFLVVELASRDALRRAKPDFAAHAALLPPIGTDVIYAYTQDIGPDGVEAGCDVQARAFEPLVGVVESPATGSAAAALTAALAELRSDGDMHLRVGQGFDMGRPSLLLARVNRALGDVHVGGRCVAMMQGTFDLGYPHPEEGDFS